MPSTQHHIIRRQVLHVEVLGTESDGSALQRRLPELCQDSLIRALAGVFERSVPAYEHWMIDRLEIDAGMLSLENFDRDWVETVTQAIEKLLRERAPPAGSIRLSSPIQRRTDAQSVQEAFLHFLRTGSLPWWFHLPAGTTLEEVVRACWQAARQTGSPPEDFGRSMIDAIGSAPMRNRLVRQFSADFLETLLTSFSREGATAVNEVFAKLRISDVASGALRRFSEQLWQTAFAMAAAGRRPTASALVAECMNSLPSAERQEPALLERITQLWPEALSRDSAPEEKARQKPELRERITQLWPEALSRDSTPEEKALHSSDPNHETHHFTDEMIAVDLEDGVYIGCAGLVLLHPFLPRLFEALGIAAEGKLAQPERALCLLHFLATGQRFAPEYELLLPKLLCNVPFEVPVESRIELTTAEEGEAVALLEAVIHHWDALGDTSVDGLRGTFLIRPGKLSRRDNGDDLLQVETRSFDILLDRLPWGIGMIQLPWMKKILWVEWWY